MRSSHLRVDCILWKENRKESRGVFVFRMASGLVQLLDVSHTTLELISATMADGMTAISINLAMSFGLIIPKIAIDRIGEARGF